MSRFLPLLNAYAGSPAGQDDVGAPLRPGRSGGPDAFAGARGGGGDRFCAWGGRSGRRIIVAVLPLDPRAGAARLALPLGDLVLGVHRPGHGRRRVAWIDVLADQAAVDRVRRAALALAAEDGELHLHRLADGQRERDALVADLGFPRLAAGQDSASSGASMNPPDCLCQRSA